MRRALAALVLLTACATVHSPAARVASDEAEAPRCASFADFDARVQEDSDELVAHGRSEELVAGAAGLSRARRACARHVISGFIDRRETEGVDTVQAELDALARAFSPEDLEALLAEVLGVQELELRPLVAEAIAHRSRAAAKTPAQPARKDDRLTCAERSGDCELVSCLVEAHADQAELSRRARGCLDSLQALPAERRADASSKLVEVLRPLGASGPLTEALLNLETLRRQLWPEVHAAELAGRPIVAARLATPFAVLDGAREEVRQLRERAIAFHLRLARDAAPHALAARLQRLLAAEVGGPAEPPLSGEPGRWTAPRWACTWPAPKPPPAFDDVELRLTAVCRTLKAPKPRQPEPSGSMATFELEKTLQQELVEGTLSASCAGRSFRQGFSVKLMVLDTSDTERAEALDTELTSLLEKSQRQCRDAHAELARKDCEALPSLGAPEAEQRYTEAFLATGTWEPCFVEHFLRRYGVAPPVPRVNPEP